ncbi:MAG: hypothetical protein OK452_02860 [Thaumarchaeota archaeon]|nr:hypothetical protein [Nitrososphaerota archaeon]
MLIPAFLYLAPQSGAASSPQRRLGFGFIGIGSLRGAGFSASSFFKGYFLTPPYPSTVQLLENNGIGEIMDQNNVNFILSLMQYASAYPNIKIGLEVAFNVSDSTQWSVFVSTINILKSSPYSSSIGFVGFAVEQLNIIDGGAVGVLVDNAFSQANEIITGNGWQFISYYPQGWQGTIGGSNNWLFTDHTNYPTGDTQANLNDGLGSTNIVGQTIGSDGLQPFPSVGCSSVYGYDMPAWSTQTFAEGFLGSGYNSPAPCHNIVTSSGFPPTIDQAISAAASLPASNRQWVLILGGNSADGYGALSSCGCIYTYSVGASGVSSHFLWDNVVFRGTVNSWVQANPGIFLLGNLTRTSSTTTSSSSASQTSDSATTVSFVSSTSATTSTRTTSYPTTSTTTISTGKTESGSTQTSTTPSQSGPDGTVFTIASIALIVDLGVLAVLARPSLLARRGSRSRSNNLAGNG